MASGLFTSIINRRLINTVRLTILLCAVVLPGSGWAQDQWLRAGEAQTRDLNVLSMIYVPQHPSFPQGVIFAGTLEHGLWRSTDGDHWASSGLDGKNVTALAAAPDGTLYAGTGKVVNSVHGTLGLNEGIFRSSDGGASWQAVNNGLINPAEGINDYLHVACLAVNSQGDVFAATKAFREDQYFKGNFFRSTDRGQNWTLVSETIHHSEVTAIWIDSDDSLLLGANDNTPEEDCFVYRLTPNANTILSWYQWLGSNGPKVTCLYRYPASGNFFAGMVAGVSYASADRTNVFRSTDAGVKWTEAARAGGKVLIPNDPMLANYAEVVSLATRPQGELFAAVISPVAGEHVFRSVDNGVNWENVSRGLSGITINRMVTVWDGELFLGTSAGFFRSTWAVPVELSDFQVE